MAESDFEKNPNALANRSVLLEEEGDAPSIPIFSDEASFYLVDSEFELLYLHPTATLAKVSSYNDLDSGGDNSIDGWN